MIVISSEEARQTPSLIGDEEFEVTYPGGQTKSKKLKRIIRSLKRAEKVSHDEENFYYTTGEGTYAFPLIKGLSVSQHYYLLEPQKVKILYTYQEVENKMLMENMELQCTLYTDVIRYAQERNLLFSI